MKFVLTVFILLLASGCTSMFKVMTDDPVRATNIRSDEEGRDAVATISLDASRRNVIVKLTDDATYGRFCAEPPPDTASAIESILDATAKANSEVGESTVGGEATLKDTYKSDVVIIAKRTELLDIYRTGTYALCQYHLNDAIDGNELKTLFESLTNQVLLRVNISSNNKLSESSK